ncbi:DUF5302 domain-containing protein [Mycobacterium sp. 4D054]|uniref:DUF5302 domain-containing protein n=1 Tax=unclassified Mycobacterium TaxID=2642494 RepID=UPI0021B38D44|nr:DUF5302 domain-containing protein [Mycobacterium sp. SMC-8]UXA12224.1 DUF5302 domain-containing protein [Mycobacterium sp. SMC-8]
MASNEPAESDEDDQKRKFREALERKNAKAVKGSSHKDGGANTARGSHGPVENRREFRRKSG